MHCSLERNDISKRQVIQWYGRTGPIEELKAVGDSVFFSSRLLLYYIHDVSWYFASILFQYRQLYSNHWIISHRCFAFVTWLLPTLSRCVQKLRTRAPTEKVPPTKLRLPRHPLGSRSHLLSVQCITSAACSLVEMGLMQCPFSQVQ